MSQGPQGVASGRPSPGYFLLTLDTELAWGSFDQGIDPELLRGTRVAIRRLLALLDRYQIPATGTVTIQRQTFSGILFGMGLTFSAGCEAPK